MADDFTRLRGITPKIAARLREAGIERFAALAALKPDEIVELIGSVGGVTVDTIEKRDWIRQARALALGRELPPEGVEAEAGRRADFAVALVLNPDNTVNHTHVLHLQSGDECQWVGWADRHVLEFLAEQSGLRPETSPAAVGVSPAPPAASRRLETAAEPPHRSAAAGPQTANGNGVEPTPAGHSLEVLSSHDATARHIVPHEQPFTVRVRFALGMLEPKPGRGATYRATLYAKQLGPGQRSVLRAAEGVATSTNELQFDMADVMLVRGAYRLGAEIALIAGARATPTTGYVEGALLQVV